MHLNLFSFGLVLFHCFLHCIASPNLLFTTDEILEAYAPRVFFHSQDVFFPDSAEFVFEASLQKECVVKNELSFAKREIKCNSNETTAGDIGNLKSWLDIPDKLFPGNLSRAEAYIHRRLVNESFTDIVVFLFYPYNGPAYIRAKCGVFRIIGDKRLARSGRHEGDWEHFTLRINHMTKRPESIFQSRHGGGYWIDYDNLEADERDGRKVIYSAKYSHAFYSTRGKHSWCLAKSYNLGFCTFKAELLDETDQGTVSFEPWNRYQEIDSTSEDSAVARYRGRWGNYERIIESVHPVYTDKRAAVGPTGPIMKDAWFTEDVSQNPHCS